eukprot:gene4678-5727_t
MTVGQILSWLDLDLDRRLDESPNDYWLDTEALESSDLKQNLLTYGNSGFPYLRTTGAVINMRHEFYNYNLAPGYESERGFFNSGAETVCILYLSAAYKWSEKWSDPETSYGEDTDNVFVGSG